MNLDRMLHEKKNFAELENSDVEAFLRDRPFRSEHLNLEFKREFPKRNNGKYVIVDICKYIAGLSNEEGGLVFYGVADSIKDSSAEFPEYLPGLSDAPTLEDLGQWVKERIHPLVASPAIRFFEVAGLKLAIIKVPSGPNKPYCYHDPGTKSLTFFKKTAGGIAELGPDEVREYYRTSLIEQSAKIAQAFGLPHLSGSKHAGENEPQLAKQKKTAIAKLENPEDFGYVGIYCSPLPFAIDAPVEELKEFLDRNAQKFSESFRYSPGTEVSQNCVSAAYFPRAIRRDIKSTCRVTVCRTGLVAFDSQADTLMDSNNNLNPYWFAYELQRHLQLAKAVLEPYAVSAIRALVQLDNIANFSIAFDNGVRASKYNGNHEPISRDVPLSQIHAFDGAERNVVMQVVKEIMDEVCRIFGLSKTLLGVWDAHDSLTYVKGLEGIR